VRLEQLDGLRAELAARTEQLAALRAEAATMRAKLTVSRRSWWRRLIG
jgi:hypothetical protein